MKYPGKKVGATMEANTPGQLRFGEMIQKLLLVDDESWGRYAFSRDILNHRIGAKEKSEMILKAIACGKEYANRMILESGNTDIQTIAQNYKLKIELQNASITGKRILFARYTPPDQIEIMGEPVHKAVSLISEECPDFIELFKKDDIIETILGHEIFHYLEEQNNREIYTRNEKILLWNFMGFKNYSTIHVLSEIGAMAFTRELKGLSYSPFLLDFLLYYSYDSFSAEKIYRDILGKSSERCIDTIENY